MTALPTRHTAVHAFVAAMLACAATLPPAAHAASRDQQEHACRGDALRLCSAHIPDKAKITACMKAHYDQLSPGCQTMFGKRPASDSRKD